MYREIWRHMREICEKYTEICGNYEEICGNTRKIWRNTPKYVGNMKEMWEIISKKYVEIMRKYVRGDSMELGEIPSSSLHVGSSIERLKDLEKFRIFPLWIASRYICSGSWKSFKFLPCMEGVGGYGIWKNSELLLYKKAVGLGVSYL